MASGTVLGRYFGLALDLNYSSHHRLLLPGRGECQKESGEFGGLGLEVTMEDGTIRVVAPLDGTPAHQAELLPGDRIIRLEDTLVQGMSLDEAVSQMRGEPGTQIRLLIVREGQPEPFEITLKRAIIRIDKKKKSFDSD